MDEQERDAATQALRDRALRRLKITKNVILVIYIFLFSPVWITTFIAHLFYGAIMSGWGMADEAADWILKDDK